MTWRLFLSCVVRRDHKPLLCHKDFWPRIPSVSSPFDSKTCSLPPLFAEISIQGQHPHLSLRATFPSAFSLPFSLHAQPWHAFHMMAAYADCAPIPEQIPASVSLFKHGRLTQYKDHIRQALLLTRCHYRQMHGTSQGLLRLIPS